MNFPKKVFLIIAFLSFIINSVTSQNIAISKDDATKFAILAMKCIHQPYPYKPGNVLGSDEDAVPPRVHHPAFYGCFDWHSAVHGHWMLVKLLKEFPDLEIADDIRSKIGQNLTKENIETEIQFIYDENNKTFERTYGWAWLLKLTEELITWQDLQGQAWAKNLQPLADSIVSKYIDFLPRLNYPIRVGEHTNTAFGLSYAWDYANTINHTELKKLIEKRAKEYYLEDMNCPLTWEPSGYDFLSPCLIEADLMSRILSNEEFGMWLYGFMPGSFDPDFSLEPAIVSDRTDGKLIHLDGLNLSRAWCLYHIAEKVSNNNQNLIKHADEHLTSALPQITSGSYEGEHWLASFAVYAIFAQPK